VLFLACKPAILNIAWGNPDNLTERRHLSAHFGLKYLSNDGTNRDRFYCENFPKIHIFRSAKKFRANFEWSVLLICSIQHLNLLPEILIKRNWYQFSGTRFLSIKHGHNNSTAEKILVIQCMQHYRSSKSNLTRSFCAQSASSNFFL